MESYVLSPKSIITQNDHEFGFVDNSNLHSLQINDNIENTNKYIDAINNDQKDYENMLPG